MDRQRNSKGQFLPGNNKGIHFTADNARGMGSRGGNASRDAKRARKTLADTLREELEKPASERGTMTKQEYIVAKCLETLAKKKCFPKDFKILSEVLGETTQNISIAEANIKVVRSEDEARKLENIKDLGV